MDKKQSDHRESDYKQRLNALLSAIEEKCLSFDSKEALRICAEKKEVFGYRERMRADIPVLKGIVESCRRLSEESRSISAAMRILAEKGIEVEKILKERRRDTENRLNDIVIGNLFRYLDEVGVPDGGELYAATAGILIYTETIPATKFKLSDDVKVFELTGAQMDKLRKGFLDGALKRHKKRLLDKLGEGGVSGDEAKKFLARRSPKKSSLPTHSNPLNASVDQVVEGTTHKLPRGSILPHAGRRKRGVTGDRTRR